MPITVPTDPLHGPRAGARIVAIGASAGGLAALEQFFEQVTPDSGLAYVVVQHLNPTEKSLLVELLQRVTTLPVREAAGATRIEPDSVYVIAPNREVIVAGGVLKSELPSEPRGMRLPINLLFSSLARDQGDRAIAVVLSGMGSDGTLGLASIKALGGLVLVQQPESAQFDSMPKSAIATGHADIVALAAELPARIEAYIAQAPQTLRADPPVAQAAETAPADALQQVFALLLQRTRHDFSLYKPSTLLRRMERRMAIHSIASLQDYTGFLSENAQELDLLFKELLIGVTSFFRDAAVWQQLADVVLPELLSRRKNGQKLRAWIVGCSTGEEAYSLAMVFAEVLARLPEHSASTLQIFASDLSADAIAVARRGQYAGAIAGDVSAERLERFFTAKDGTYRIAKSIRDSVLFAQHDVILDPPFTRLDVVCCRNLMIYFDATLQRRLLPLFHYTLQPGGLMLLGSSETVGRFNRLFTPLDSKLRLYLRLEAETGGSSDFLAKPFPPLSSMKKELAVSPPALTTRQADSLQTAADHLLLQVHAPPAVVVNKEGDIAYITGHTGKYLEPAAGKANLNFHAMVREGLRDPIATALDQALTQSEPIQLRGLQVKGSQGLQRVDVTVHAVQEPGVLKGMTMIVFRDAATLPAGRSRRKAQSDAEALHLEALQQCREEIQSLREETRASKEELQSANEELQSTNEELQSTNEELTTSKEEMQSMNEELQTINAEMQTKLDDLALAQSDMKNLLNSTDIAMLFLDKDLNVRRYTDRASKIINLRESDIGRPLSDLTMSLQYASLHDDVHETVRTLKFSEKQIFTSDERWFSVRIMPYRRLDNVIDGAVITFVDITATKELESRLRKDPTLLPPASGTT
ncbi:MAG: chemotaxis protein CheB [Pseudomonadota bacterium]